MSTPEAKKALIQRLYDRLMAQSDVNAAHEILADNFVDHDIPGLGEGDQEAMIQTV